MPRLLVVDDEPGITDSLRKIFEREDIDVVVASSGESALIELQAQTIDVVLTDLRMARLSGLDLLRTIVSQYPQVEVILMTAYATVENAVEAMRHGAYDVVTKPFRRLLVTRVVRRALEKRALVVENQTLRSALARTEDDLVGTAPAFRRAIEVADQVSVSDATVLLIGESGTGKELFARRIHARSERAKERLVAINCAALPESLIESELFGHERGSFTGAVQAHSGSFRRANRGTLFLDEIGELPPFVQPKLLRVLQDGEVQPVGGVSEHVNVRLVAATHRDLQVEVKAGRFREDLFYRLNVVQIRLPPLRERSDDLPMLVDVLVRRAAKKLNKPVPGVSPALMRHLLGYPFPGNVRELENALERAVILARQPTLSVEDLPESMAAAGVDDELAPPKRGAFVFPFGTTLDEMERLAIRDTLLRTGGDKELAAKLLGISLRTIYRKLGEPEPPATPTTKALP